MVRTYPIDPVSAYIKEHGHAYTFGLMPDGDPMRPATGMLTYLLDGCERIRKALQPRGATTLGIVKQVQSEITPKTHITLRKRMELIAYVAHIRGIKDQLNDLERECWVLMQVSHDPRIGRTHAYRDLGTENANSPSGRKVARHEARKSGKPRKPRVFMNPREVDLP